MESIDGSEFDLVLVGTGLSQSLLALALSRSGKKILHIDQNDYYGGSHAALSLQEVEAWVKQFQGCAIAQEFCHAQLLVPDSPSQAAGHTATGLGFSRAYSLALAPQIVYSRSALIPTLVSSQVHKQLEFLAVGAWWIYDVDEGAGAAAYGDQVTHVLKRIPGGREDIFADSSIGLKAKRSLMKFLKTVADPDAYTNALAEWGCRSFEEYLSQCFGLSAKLLSTIHALTLSPLSPSHTKVSYALPRIARHLASIGVFGPEFGAIIPKWGGLAEITQVACRACAVGGGIYMLSTDHRDGNDIHAEQKDLTSFTLTSGDIVRTSKMVLQQPPMEALDGLCANEAKHTARAITIVSSSFKDLFPPIGEDSTSSACTIIVFPAGSLSRQMEVLPHPAYLTIHSSDTGECPAGQCVIYSSLALQRHESGSEWLQLALHAFLGTRPSGNAAEILWQLRYFQRNRDIGEASESTQETAAGNVLNLPPGNSTDLVFDDSVLQDVRRTWQTLSGESIGFMQFETREGSTNENDHE